MAKVKGDSMKDAGIYSGDRIQVELGSSVYEGDIVVASIDGECTVKAYCIDEMNCPWLVPRNDAYNAIPLTDDKKVRIIGKVLEIIRDAPRTSHNEMLKCIKRTRGKVNAEERKITPERIHDIIYEMGEVVKHGRQWYAVYRAMVDKGVVVAHYVALCIGPVLKVVTGVGCSDDFDHSLSALLLSLQNANEASGNFSNGGSACL